MAGLTSLLPTGTNSLDMWSREEIVLNLDQDTYWGLWAIRQGNYKLIWGQRKLLKTHVHKESLLLADGGRGLKLEFYPLKKDPEERKNLVFSPLLHCNSTDK